MTDGDAFSTLVAARAARRQPEFGGGVMAGRSRNLILAAMIFAVAMTFIDQTIVSIAVTNEAVPA